jgi:hypothetical protein
MTPFFAMEKTDFAEAANCYILLVKSFWNVKIDVECMIMSAMITCKSLFSNY